MKTSASASASASASVPVGAAWAQTVVAVVAALIAASPLCQAADHKIILPDDVDVLTVQGSGFNLQLTQLTSIKEKWEQLTDEARQVETPRPLDEDSARVNVNLFEKIIAEQQRLKEQEEEEQQQQQSSISPSSSADSIWPVASEGPNSQFSWPSLSASPSSLSASASSKFLGSLYPYSRADFDGTRRITKELYDWIQRRTEAIARKYEAYAGELKDARIEPARAIATHVLLLNTNVDLQNIVQEKFDANFRSAVWIRKKLASLSGTTERSLSSTKLWLKKRFDAVLRVESKSRAVNYEWMANVRDIKRFLHEQKFSEELAQQCSEFLGQEWIGLSRSRHLELNKDKLSYANGLGELHKPFGSQVAFQLPFAVQDSILRGY